MSEAAPTVIPAVLLSVVALRVKRSISLPAELSASVDDAARDAGTTVSAWLAETASRRLKLEAGLEGVAAWERECGPLSDSERREGERWASRLLALTVSSTEMPRGSGSSPRE